VYNLFRMYLAQRNTAFFFWVIICVWLLAACGVGRITPSATQPTFVPTTLPTPSETPTPLQPSPTPQPLAGTVNGEAITLEEFQQEFARYLAAQGDSLDSSSVESEKHVLDDLINQVLLAQGARQAGYTLDEATVQERLDELITQVGGEQVFSAWLSEQGYNDDSFRKSLARLMAASWMRDKIISQVPETAEQVHARQILLYNSQQAEQVMVELKAGKDFATLAATYDPLGLGELGWFPRGYLTEALLEDAIFSLQPGEYTLVIESEIGFHIVEMLERETQRPLEPDAKLVWQERALQEWLEEHQNESEIEILLPDS